MTIFLGKNYFQSKHWNYWLHPRLPDWTKNRQKETSSSGIIITSDWELKWWINDQTQVLLPVKGYSWSITWDRWLLSMQSCYFVIKNFQLINKSPAKDCHRHCQRICSKNCPLYIFYPDVLTVYLCYIQNSKNLKVILRVLIKQTVIIHLHVR